MATSDAATQELTRALAATTASMDQLCVNTAATPSRSSSRARPCPRWTARSTPRRRASGRDTLFIVSSKSGSTLEPNIFEQYFFDRVQRLVGPTDAGRRFIAITDPGSKLDQVGERHGFRHVFFGWTTIGGRYSALSDFGLVPAAVMGVDVARFLDRTEEMASACMRRH